jgi:hypothetical protein
MRCLVPGGFLSGAARADLVAVVEVPEIIERRGPQMVTVRVLEVLLGSEGRALIRVMGGVDSDHQSWKDLGASRVWVVSLVASSNEPRESASYVLQFHHEAALMASNDLAIGRVTDDDAQQGRFGTIRLLDLRAALSRSPLATSCITKR